MEAALPNVVHPRARSRSLAGLLLRLWWMVRGVGSAAAPGRVDEREFVAVVDRHRNALERLCYFRERDPVKRQDLWQDTLLALWRSLPSFRGDGSEKAWVMRVAHNVAASHVARAMRDRRDPTEVPPAPADPPERRAEATELWERLQRLDVASQQIVLLYLEGLTSSEIAQATGLSPSNVTTRLSRIRRRLVEEQEA